MQLDDSRPADRRLALVYRAGAALTAAALLVFGILGFRSDLAFFSTAGDRVAGLSTNGLLSLVSVLAAAVLLVGAALGGAAASWINTVLGAAFLLSGGVNEALMYTRFNVLDFRMQNVVFSFAVGLMLLTFGLYGRVSGALPHDNPNWRRRHPEQARHEDEVRAALARGGLPAARALIAGVPGGQPREQRTPVLTEAPPVRVRHAERQLPGPAR